MNEIKSYEVIIIGGGHAGLSAALALGRARRKVLVVDWHHPRNEKVTYAHGFYTRDCVAPEEIIRIGRKQLDPYGVEFFDGQVTDVTKSNDGFEVVANGDIRMQAKKIILATGVSDILPEKPGFKEFWGKSIFTCPYCHGWEVAGQKLVVIGNGKKAYNYALVIQQWNADITICTDGASEFNDEQKDYLRKEQIPIVEGAIARVEGTAGRVKAIQFEDGKRLNCEVIFMQPPYKSASDLPMRLGCEMEKDDNKIVIDFAGRTSVPGVYAAGDAATRLAQVVIAAASGVTAAFTLNHDLVAERHGL